MSLRDTAICEIDDDAGEPGDDAPALRVVRCGRADFTGLETKVISLARRDGLASLEAPGRTERLVALLFGIRHRVHALADARLEALRRAVVVTRHRHHMPDTVAAELRRAGFAGVQLRAIEAMATYG